MYTRLFITLHKYIDLWFSFRNGISFLVLFNIQIILTSPFIYDKYTVSVSVLYNMQNIIVISFYLLFIINLKILAEFHMFYFLYLQIKKVKLVFLLLRMLSALFLNGINERERFILLLNILCIVVWACAITC